MEEPQLVRIEVGKKFPLFSQSVEKLKGTDGAFFEAEMDQGYMFCVHFANVNFTDKQIFRNEKISVKILQGDGGMVLPLVKFGKSMMFEMSFDPTLYDDDRALQLSTTSNILSIFLIESNDGELKAIRQCNLPLKMIQICREAWGRAILDINFSEKFNAWMARMSNYPLEVLWERATKVGDMGETYDLREITMPNVYKPQGDVFNEKDSI